MLKHEIGLMGTGPMRSAPGGEEMENRPRLVPIRTIYVEISPIRQDVKGEFYIDSRGIHGL
jgi:hypothetical protein